jgi:hypothetical protein
LAEDNRGKSFCDRILRNAAVAVAQQYYGQIIVRETVQFRGKSRTATLRGHDTVSEAAADVPTVSVTLAFHKVRLARRFLQDDFAIESAIEPVKIVDGGIE